MNRDLAAISPWGRRLLVWALLGAAALGAGCATSVPVVQNPLPIDVHEYGRVYRAAVLTLRHDGFIVDRHDYRFGEVTSKPRRAGTLFEPWKTGHDNLGVVLADTINEQRRIVRISLTPKPVATQPATPSVPAGPVTASRPVSHTYLLKVDVLVQRHEIPGQHMNGATDPGQIFSPQAQPSQELKDRGITGPYWETVGQDPAMEQRLINQIMDRSLLLGPDP